MKSSTTPDFWASYQKLPPEIKARARTAHRLWRANPRYPSLRFKKVGDLWSIRISSGYRALALFQDDTFFWFWIGSHDEYEQLLPDE
jgi:hypothetical protein